MQGGMWTDLGEYAPSGASPFDQDPFQMTDLRDPSQPAGPFEGMGQVSSQPPTQQQQWTDIGQQAATMVSQVGDVFAGQEAMKAAQKLAKQGAAGAPVQGAYGATPFTPPAPGMSTKSIVLMVLAGAAVVGIGVWLVMRKKRR